MGPTTQVFRLELKEPILLPPTVAGMPQTFTVTAAISGDLFASVGPLDRKKFKAGDKVKVIVQRIGKR